MNAVVLLNGAEAANDSEEWRHECEARAITALPTLAERQAWLDDIERKRGKPAADRLRATMRLLWQQRQRSVGK